MQLWKWALGLIGVGAVGYKVNQHYTQVPRPGDIAVVPVGKVQPVVQPGTLPAAIAALAASITTPLTDGTIFVNVLAAPDAGGKIMASVRNVAGATIPVFIFQPDISKLTRSGVVVFP
jgi:hypothetical protein